MPSQAHFVAEEAHLNVQQPECAAKPVHGSPPTPDWQTSTCPPHRWSAHRSHCQRLGTLGWDPINSRHHPSLITHPRRWTPPSRRPLCRRSTPWCPQSQRTGLPWTPSQFQVPFGGPRNRSERPLERGSRFLHHQPRPSQNTWHSSTCALCGYRFPHLQMDSFPHPRSIHGICSQPPFRRSNPPSQSRWRSPTFPWPPPTTPTRPRRPQSPPPPFRPVRQWALCLVLAFGLCTSGTPGDSPA